MCGSAVKIRCCLRSSAAGGIALQFCSTAVSCAAAPALKPSMVCGAEGGDARIVKKQNAGNMTAVRERNGLMPFLPELDNNTFTGEPDYRRRARLRNRFLPTLLLAGRSKPLAQLAFPLSGRVHAELRVSIRQE